MCPLFIYGYTIPPSITFLSLQGKISCKRQKTLGKLLDLAPNLAWSGRLKLHSFGATNPCWWRLLPRISVLREGRVKRLELVRLETPHALLALFMHPVCLLGAAHGHPGNKCGCCGFCMCGLRAAHTDVEQYCFS